MSERRLVMAQRKRPDHPRPRIPHRQRHHGGSTLHIWQRTPRLCVHWRGRA